MRRLWTTRVVAAPPARVWELLIDLDAWPRWGPTVRDARLDSGGRRLHAGATGRLRTAAAFAVSFEVTEFDPGRCWAWTVAGVPATGHRIETLDASRCRVGFSVPPLAAPYLAVCRIALARVDALATGDDSGTP